jgi:uncharacterized protein (DUF736 family)
MQQKENTGAIFKNEKKTPDTQPEYKGKINVDGVEKDIALWVNTSKSGLTYFSAKISEPFKSEERPQQVNESNKGTDLPF